MNCGFAPHVPADSTRCPRDSRPRRPMTPQSAHISPARKIIQSKRPSMFDALGEFRVPLEASIYWLGALSHPWPHAKPHNAKVVMLIPGFMAGDLTLAPLAKFF